MDQESACPSLGNARTLWLPPFPSLPGGAMNQESSIQSSLLPNVSKPFSSAIQGEAFAKCRTPPGLGKSRALVLLPAWQTTALFIDAALQVDPARRFLCFPSQAAVPAVTG